MTNVDNAEINKFGEIAHQWWDTQSMFKPLHEINPLRLNFINNNAHLNGLTVLDVGCGGGILSESMSKLGAVVTAIDLGEQAFKRRQVTRARKRCRSQLPSHCRRSLG